MRINNSIINSDNNCTQTTSFILSYLHGVIQSLCKVCGNTPGALDWKRWNNVIIILAPTQRKWCQNRNSSYPRPAGGPSGIRRFPSWCSPPSRIQTASCRHQTLKQKFRISRSPSFPSLWQSSKHTHTHTHLSLDAQSFCFPGWWRTFVHLCQTSSLRPGREPVPQRWIININWTKVDTSIDC